MEMSYPISDIEGIGKTHTNKLRKSGITQTKHLLDRGATKKGRAQVAKDTGLSEKLVLKWTNMADLMRVKGVGEEYSELLEAAGVDTVKELRNRKPENLHLKMIEVNGARKNPLVRQLPGPSKVESWVKQAKKMKPVMTY